MTSLLEIDWCEEAGCPRSQCVGCQTFDADVESPPGAHNPGAPRATRGSAISTVAGSAPAGGVGGSAMTPPVSAPPASSPEPAGLPRDGLGPAARTVKPAGWEGHAGGGPALSGNAGSRPSAAAVRVAEVGKAHLVDSRGRALCNGRQYAEADIHDADATARVWARAERCSHCLTVLARREVSRERRLEFARDAQAEENER